LDTLEPPPTTVLLSAEEAKTRLREIVEGFFFRRLKGEDRKHIRRLLIKSPPGLGKTREAIDWAIRYQAEQQAKGPRDLLVADQNEAGVPAQTSIFVPRHQLAEELRGLIEGAFRERGEPITVPILRGRENGGEEGKAPCLRWREARALARKGLPIYTNLCERRIDSQALQCPYFAGCEYIQTRQAAYSSPFVILVHSHLGLEWGATAAERAEWASDGPADQEDDTPERPRYFNPKQANLIICDEDPTASLVEQAKLSPEDIRGLGTDGLGDTILAGLVHPSGLLTFLRDQGVSPDRFRQAVEDARKTERSRGQISSPEAGDGDIVQAAQSAPRLVRMSGLLERLANELASGRAGPAYSLLREGDDLIAQGRRPWVFDNQRLLLLDGTANPEILRQFVPQLQDVPEIGVRRNAYVIQVRDLTFFRGSLVERPTDDEKGAWRPTARLVEVAEFIRGVAANEGRTLVVTNKRVRCALTGEKEGARLPVSARFAGADIAHFGNIRGTDKFKDHDVVIVLGREQPSPRDAERLAKAIWYDTKEPIRCIKEDKRGQVDYSKRRHAYTMRDGSQQSVEVKVHPDPRVQAVVEQVREAEMLQSIDRLRLIHTQRRKTVLILCNIPLGIPIDQLVTWRQLAGDGRLADALAACETHGWEALPLAPSELARLLPDLWTTAKAAERWIVKNPLNPQLSTIRLWGVVNRYRPPGQTSWSKAVVRHGADPRTAIAGVLGVAAEDVQVRELARQTLSSTPVRPPARTPPVTQPPIRTRRRTQVSTCKALPLETTSGKNLTLGTRFRGRLATLSDHSSQATATGRSAP
jgi:hypothetical protein